MIHELKPFDNMVFTWWRWNAPLTGLPALMFYHDENLITKDFFVDSILSILFRASRQADKIKVFLTNWHVELDHRTLLLLIFGHQPRTNLSRVNEDFLHLQGALHLDSSRGKLGEKACHVYEIISIIWRRKRRKFICFRCVGIFVPQEIKLWKKITPQSSIDFSLKLKADKSEISSLYIDRKQILKEIAKSKLRERF